MNKDRSCGHWNGAAATRCGATPTRHYLTGHRCPDHTPAAVAGQPEPPEPDGPLPGAWTTPTSYQAAKAATSRST